MPARAPKPSDLLTARQIAEEYGIPRATADSIVRKLQTEGRVWSMAGLRRTLVRREGIEPVSGPTP
jgi:DNA-binding IscR family transcriptional regulator